MPSSTINECTTKIRNFLWFGYCDKHNLVIVMWEKVTRPRNKEGLALRQLRDINLTMLMKLVWSFMLGSDELGKFLTFKYVNKNGDIIISTRSLQSRWGLRRSRRDHNGQSVMALK